MSWLIVILALALTDAPKDKAKDAKTDAPAAKAKAKGAGTGTPKDAPEDEPAKSKRAIDATYQPAAGDRAVLLSMDQKGETFFLWGAATPEGFREYKKAEVMEDEKRKEQLEKEGKAVELDDDTEVGVLNIEPVSIQVNAQGGISGVVATVRVLSGSNKGKVLLTNAENVVRVVKVADAPAGRRPSTRKAAKSGTPKAADATAKGATVRKAAPDPAARASLLLKMGQGLEKSGKTAGAVDFYRQVVKRYPDTPQARTAAARVKAIEAK